MSFHFTNGNLYSAYSDTGPGDIVVDPLATVQTNGAGVSALTLASGDWDITVNGKVTAANGHAVNIRDSGTFVSTIDIGPVAEISGGGTLGYGINAALPRISTMAVPSRAIPPESTDPAPAIFSSLTKLPA
jgi:hypothetical protein